MAYRHADGEEKPSKRSKSESTLKKKVQGCVSQNSAESWANELARFGGTRFTILGTHLVRSSNSGKKRAISRRYPKR